MSDITYPVIIHKDQRSDYGVTVPDLPGCFSAGATLDEAMAMAREAVELHLEGLIESGEMIPKAQPLELHQKRREYAGGIWAVVSINLASLRMNARRINITLPERILHAVDAVAAARHETRSGFLAKAATVYLKTPRKEASRSLSG